MHYDYNTGKIIYDDYDDSSELIGQEVPEEDQDESFRKAAKKRFKEEAKKKAAKELSKAATKKVATKISTKALFTTPVGWVIAIAIIVIIVIVGLIGFFILMPGLVKNKLTSFTAQIWSNITGNKADAITQQDITDVKKYLADMGIDLVGFGFVKDAENAEYDEDKQQYPKDDNDIYIKSYLAAELETYSFETKGEVYSWLGPLLQGIANKREASGMIRFKNEQASGLFQTTLNGLITYTQNSSGNMSYSTNQHDFRVGAWIDQIFNSADGSISYEAKITDNGIGGSPKLIISTKESLFSDKITREYDLKEWCEQYGLPSYFLIALHIGTMAPDFALTVATTIEPKVEFDFAVTDVETIVIRDQKPDECAQENMEHEWDDANATTLPDGKKLSQCLNGCGAECEWEVSNPDSRTIREGRQSETQLPTYKTLIPYITKIKTWYKIFDYGKMTQSNEPQELPEYVYDGDDEDMKGAIIKETIVNPLKMDSAKVKEIDNSQYFRALLKSDKKIIENRKNFVYFDEQDGENKVYEEGYEEALSKIDYIDEEGYRIYPGTQVEDINNLEKKKIEPTSSLQMAIEMIEDAPGSGSKVIARELKKILEFYGFTIHEINYPTTITQARLSTFEFIIPNYYPSLWPTVEEIKTDCTKILVANGDEEGFSPNSEVIMPATGIIESQTGDSITLKFTEQNSYGMKMIIKGVIPEGNIELNDNGEVDRKTVIGVTGTGDITIILRDKNNQLLNVSEYMDGVYLRYPAVISKGLAYPVYNQAQSPWGDMYFYEDSESQTDEQNKTYEEVGSGSTVIAMALSGLTRLTVTPEAIKYKINELGLDVDTYVKQDGLEPEILEPEKDTLTGEDTLTNEFLDSYGVEVINLNKVENGIQRAIEGGHPVILYATYTHESEQNKQYFLLLPSSNENYDYYLIDPKESENSGLYNADNFTQLSYDTSLNVEVAYALNKQI